MEVTAFSLNEEPQRVRAFRFFAFEAYWRQLYTRPRSIWWHERLMKGAPPCLRVPYSPDLDPGHLRELIARDEQRLLNSELFEVDRYPPMVGEADDGPLMPLDLDKLSCTRQWLAQFCWKGVPSSLLDGFEALSMRRFELILSALCDLRSWSFSHPVYSAEGSPYVKVVRYICRGIQAAFEAGEAGCSWITSSQRTDGPRTEELVAHDRDKGMGCAQAKGSFANGALNCLGRIYFLIDLSRETPARKPTAGALEARKRRSAELIEHEMRKKGKAVASKGS